jgi:hypothetical protein
MRKDGLSKGGGTLAVVAVNPADDRSKPEDVVNVGLIRHSHRLGRDWPCKQGMTD